MMPPRFPRWAERNWPPEEPALNLPLGDHSWASISAAGSRVPLGSTAVPWTMSWPSAMTSASAVTPCTTVLSAPTLIVSPGSSCGGNVVQHPPAPARWAALTPPSAGAVAGMLTFLPVAMVTPSRTTETTALFAKPPRKTSERFAVTTIVLLAPATAAEAGCAHRAQPAAAATTGVSCRKWERDMDLTHLRWGTGRGVSVRLRTMHRTGCSGRTGAPRRARMLRRRAADASGSAYSKAWPTGGGPRLMRPGREPLRWSLHAIPSRSGTRRLDQDHGTSAGPRVLATRPRAVRTQMQHWLKVMHRFSARERGTVGDP